MLRKTVDTNGEAALRMQELLTWAWGTHTHITGQECPHRGLDPTELAAVPPPVKKRRGGR